MPLQMRLLAKNCEKFFTYVNYEFSHAPYADSSDTEHELMILNIWNIALTKETFHLLRNISLSII